jgi:hypothetical protein
MGAPYSIPEIIDIAKESGVLANLEAKNQLFYKGAPLDNTLGILLTMEAYILQWRYDNFPDDPTLRQTGNYVYQLCGRFINQAIINIGQGSGQSAIPAGGTQPGWLAWRIDYPSGAGATDMVVNGFTIVITLSNVVPGTVQVSIPGGGLLQIGTDTSQLMILSPGPVITSTQITITLTQAVSSSMPFIVTGFRTASSSSSTTPVVDANVKFGVMVANSLFTNLQKINVSLALSAHYTRSSILLSSWSGSNAFYELQVANGLTVIPNLNWVAQDPVSPWPTDMTAYGAAIQSVLDTYSPPLVVIENEELNSNYHSGTAAEYVTMLQTAYPLCVAKGVKMADGGIFGIGLHILTFRWIKGNPAYGQIVANTFGNNCMRPYGVAAADDPGSNPTLEAVAADIQTILDAKDYVDYFNFHNYEDLNPNATTTERENLTVITPDVVRYTKEFIEATTGKGMITNETGQRTNEQPQLVTNVLQNYLNLGVAWVLWWSGDDDAADARALQNDNTTLRPNGIAFRDFLIAHQ